MISRLHFQMQFHQKYCFLYEIFARINLKNCIFYILSVPKNNLKCSNEKLEIYDSSALFFVRNNLRTNYKNHKNVSKKQLE